MTEADARAEARRRIIRDFDGVPQGRTSAQLQAMEDLYAAEVLASAVRAKPSDLK